MAIYMTGIYIKAAKKKPRPKRNLRTGSFFGGVVCHCATTKKWTYVYKKIKNKNLETSCSGCRLNDTMFIRCLNIHEVRVTAYWHAWVDTWLLLFIFKGIKKKKSVILFFFYKEERGKETNGRDGEGRSVKGAGSCELFKFSPRIFLRFEGEVKDFFFIFTALRPESQTAHSLSAEHIVDSNKSEWPNMDTSLPSASKFLP